LIIIEMELNRKVFSAGQFTQLSEGARRPWIAANRPLGDKVQRTFDEAFRTDFRSSSDKWSD
jgi:hypothetical protein